ncbi:MAG: hypothetical protein IPM66_03450 [Acidobacteriota bacterium]|nr:MAG: hypothetical protein IPM66_03450 [Acidobacteriota bacterium]
MTCRDLRKRIFFAAPKNLLELPEARAHIERCDDCHRMAAGERLAGLLVRARIEHDREAPGLSPFLMARIRNRIREMSDQGSWEAAILGLRGWLVAFGAAAIILLALSVQWGIAPNRTLTRDHETELSSISNVNEVLLSGNLPHKSGADNEVPGNGIDE